MATFWKFTYLSCFYDGPALSEEDAISMAQEAYDDKYPDEEDRGDDVIWDAQEVPDELSDDERDNLEKQFSEIVSRR